MFKLQNQMIFMLLQALFAQSNSFFFLFEKQSHLVGLLSIRKIWPDMYFALTGW